MNHKYDHSCYCPDCCEHEQRTADRANQDAEDHEREISEYRRAQGAELRLQLVVVGS